MGIAIRRLHPGFAGEISNVDPTRPISPEDVAAIDERMDRHTVLVTRWPGNAPIVKQAEAA
jgi:hypothetical protein